MNRSIRKLTFWQVPPMKIQISFCIHAFLIRVVVACIKKLCILSYLKRTQWRFWWDFMNAKADLNLCWAHMSEGRFSDIVAPILMMWWMLFVFIHGWMCLVSTFMKWWMWLMYKLLLPLALLYHLTMLSKKCLRKCTKCAVRSSYPCAIYHLSLCSPFIHFVVSNDLISGQSRPWSDCTDVQADLGLRCPHMPEDTFLLGVAHIILLHACQWRKEISHPAGTWRLCNIASTLMQRRDVASTLRRRCINVMCPLGT